MTKKIEDLTKKQELALDKYFEKWTKIGLSLKKLDQKKAKKLIAGCYKAGGLKPPSLIETVASPIALVRRGAELELGEAATPEKISEVSRDLLNSCCYGQQDAGWLSFYDYFRQEMGLIKETDELSSLINAAKDLHWWLPFENICLISEFPTVLKIEDDVLHCENGPAVLYSDGFSLFSLYGVQVEEWLAVTPAKELDISKVLAITNVDQRMAGIRKIGIHNVRDKLKVEVIDSYKNYELWTIEVEGRRVGPYLKMVGPTTGEIHVEGVGSLGGIDPNMKTCQQAINSRRAHSGSYVDPIFEA